MGFRIRDRDLSYDPHPAYSIHVTSIDETLAAQRVLGNDLHVAIKKTVNPDGEAMALVWDLVRVELFRCLAIPLRQGIKDVLRG